MNNSPHGLPLTRPLIYLITKGELTEGNVDERRVAVLDVIAMAIESATLLVQIREKSLSTLRLYQLVAEAVEMTRRTGTRILVNDRVDVALAAGADGVQLTGGSLSADVVRRIVPAGFLIGVSTHSVEETLESARLGADFAVFAPVFATGDKQPLGLEKLAEACSHVAPFPVIALGGVDAANCVSAIEAGASGVAGISAFNDGDSLLLISQNLWR